MFQPSEKQMIWNHIKNVKIGSKILVKKFVYFIIVYFQILWNNLDALLEFSLEHTFVSL